MDLEHRIRACSSLTPVDHAIIDALNEVNENVEALSIEDIAKMSHASPASITRFCKHIGLGSFRDLKIELRSLVARREQERKVDIDYPFSEGDTPRTIAKGLKALYELTLSDALDCMDFPSLIHAARAIENARDVRIFTHSHNSMVAESFQDRMQRIGKTVLVSRPEEQQRIVAAAADEHSVAIVISYSGRATFLPGVLKILHGNKVPVILIGTQDAARLCPSIDMHLQISDREHPQLRISQFASHIALQYALDVLYGVIFTLNYQANVGYIARTIPLIDDRRF